MKNLNHNIFDGKRNVKRNEFLKILNAGFRTNSFSFVNQAAQVWLSTYYGDLAVKKLYAESLIGLAKQDKAKIILKEISLVDPENVQVQEMLFRLENSQKEDTLDALGYLYVTGENVQIDLPIPEWSFLVRTAWQSFLGGRWDSAEEVMREIVTQKPDLSLAAMFHLKLLRERGLSDIYVRVAELYHARFPKNAAIALFLAEAKFSKNKDAEGLRLLNQCVMDDTAGCVIMRIWGGQHRFSTLWPESLEMKIAMQIPIEVTSYLGWNNLPEGDSTDSSGKGAFANLDIEEFDSDEIAENFVDLDETDFEIQEELTKKRFSSEISKPSPKASDRSAAEDMSSIKSIEDAFEKLAEKLNQPDISRTNGRFPVYVFMSSKRQLVKKYGEQTAQVIDGELNILAQLIKNKNGWGSIVYYPDDTVNSVKLGLTVLDELDPWKLKLAISDLDQSLAKKGSMIGSMMIVGGPDIIPFHALPNPTDDSDESVYSDNPYASVDGNYYITEWPVGRLPGDASKDAGILLNQIRASIEHHKLPVEEPSTFWEKVLKLFDFLNIFKKIIVKKSLPTIKDSFGLTAAVWQRASLAVFRPIGNGRELLVSPPESAGKINNTQMAESDLGYFNLHGIEDGAEWFGQKDYNDTSSSEDYPVALTPENLTKAANVPDVVYSEACYGGNILFKKEDQAISLKFLGLGTKIFVGSTCIAYGSVASPLIGADLLGKLFWRNLGEGYFAGEALMKAKIEFVQEMNKRQGFLDGEDQKTLLSFVLYGDPLMEVNDRSGKSFRSLRAKRQPEVKAMCDVDMPTVQTYVSKEKLVEVKRIVETYLPGINETRMKMTQQKLIDARELQKTKGFHYKSQKQYGDGQVVLTFHKSVHYSKGVHDHFARAKVNEQGQITKLAISR